MKILSLLILLALAAPLGAQPCCSDDDMPGNPPRHEMLMDALKLSPDQQKQVDKLRSDHMKQQIATQAKIKAARIDLRDLMNDENPDRAKIEAKETEMTKLRGELRLSRTAFWFDVQKILKPEQQKIWKDNWRMGRDEGRRHRGRMTEPPMRGFRERRMERYFRDDK